MSLFKIKAPFFFFSFQHICPLIHVADHSDMIQQITILCYSSLKALFIS